MASSYDEEYNPSSNMIATAKPEVRMANAADYTAHHIGKISRNLERLIAVLEKDRKVDGVQF